MIKLINPWRTEVRTLLHRYVRGSKVSLEHLTGYYNLASGNTFLDSIGKRILMRLVLREEYFYNTLNNHRG